MQTRKLQDRISAFLLAAFMVLGLLPASAIHIHAADGVNFTIKGVAYTVPEEHLTFLSWLASQPVYADCGGWQVSDGQASVFVDPDTEIKEGCDFFYTWKKSPGGSYIIFEDVNADELPGDIVAYTIDSGTVTVCHEIDGEDRYFELTSQCYLIGDVLEPYFGTSENWVWRDIHGLDADMEAPMPLYKTSFSRAYAVTVEESPYVTLSIDPASRYASPGQTVTVKMSSIGSVELTDIAVKDSAGHSVEVTEDTPGRKYTFVMPEGGATVSVAGANIPFLFNYENHTVPMGTDIYSWLDSRYEQYGTVTEDNGGPMDMILPDQSYTAEWVLDSSGLLTVYGDCWASNLPAHTDYRLMEDATVHLTMEVDGLTVATYLTYGDDTVYHALRNGSCNVEVSYTMDGTSADLSSRMPLEGLSLTHVCGDGNTDHSCDVCYKPIPQLCTDGEIEDHRCDICGRAMFELCTDGEDSNPHVCDVCDTFMPELCSDGEDADHSCDGCNTYMPELCSDSEDEDHLCDGCNTYMPDLCVDEDNNHICDDCGGIIASYCVDEDGNHRCDIQACGRYMSERCYDYNGDYACDECGKIEEHECISNDSDDFCDICGEQCAHVCVNDDSDGLCDYCGEVFVHDCIDDDSDGLCDECSKVMEHDCKDDDSDGLCDICGEAFIHDCIDDDRDGLCDGCGEVFIHECTDDSQNPDHWCDICGDHMPQLCTDDSQDPDHWCDICSVHMSQLCTDGELEDHCCGICGSFVSGLCYDGEDEDHLCDVCDTELCYDGEDEDHNCDECDASLCYDEDYDGICDECKGDYICPHEKTVNHRDRGDGTHTGICFYCHEEVSEAHRFNTLEYDSSGHWAVCGDCGAGDPDDDTVIPHSFEVGYYSFDDEYHYMECDECRYVAVKEPHSTDLEGDRPADCDRRAYCSVCENYYGDRHHTGEVTLIPDTILTHVRGYSCCDGISDPESHVIVDGSCECGAEQMVVFKRNGEYVEDYSTIYPGDVITAELVGCEGDVEFKWFVDNREYKIVSESTSYTVSEEDFLTANWLEACTYSVEDGTFLGQVVFKYYRPETLPGRAGHVFGGWYGDKEYTQPLSGGVEEGEEYYAKFLPREVLDIKVQITADTTYESQKTDIRFITTVDSLDYQNVTIRVTIPGIAQGEADREYTLTDTRVYTRISAAAGGVEYNYDPTVFSTESKYFMTHTITGVPQAYFDAEITAVASWTTADGSVVEGKVRTFKVSDGFAQ